ncbi:MAG: S24 family peptidase [Bacteroidetes bacterium]|nr:S24 family peptidase [Bacteroidota bacterium]
MSDLLLKRLISGFIVEFKTGKRPASLRKLMETAPEEMIFAASDSASDIIEFERLLFKSPSIKEFLIYDSEENYYVSSPKPLDRQKQQYSLGNNEKFIMFSSLLNLDEGQITFVRVEGDSMADANINDGDIVVVKNSDIANSGDIIVANVNGNYYIKRYSVVDDQLWLYSENSKYEPILIPHNSKFIVFGIVCNVIKKIVF